MASTAPLTEAEVKQCVDDWYKALDVHAPADEVVPLVAEEGLEMRFPGRPSGPRPSSARGTTASSDASSTRSTR
jgi:hypothetical protein